MTSSNPRIPFADRENAGALQSQSEALLSHDMLSAVGDILGALQLMDADQVGVENRQHLARIGAAAGLLFRLVNPDAPSVDLPGIIQTVEKIPLRELADDLQNRWKARADEKHVVLEIIEDFKPDEIWQGDRLALERLLSNLLDNAVKFTDRGKVVLSMQTSDGLLEISVRDQGPGFSDEALDLLFSFGGRPSGSTVAGSGLGLFICKKMADFLGATMRVENTPDGACVRAFVPLDAQSERIVPFRHAEPEQLLAGVHILLAEDNKTNQLVASQMLTLLGASIDVAADGVEALRLWEEQDFDLALFDIEMPRKSGLELIREIRGRGDEKSGKPLVALTAYVLAEHRRRILETGADGIIAKPLMNIEEFGKDIAVFLGEEQPVAENYGSVQFYNKVKVSERCTSPVDWQVFNALRNTIGPDAFSELLGKLVQDLADVRRNLSSGVEDRDNAKIRRASHVLVSLAGAVGATRLQETAQSLNTSAHDSDFDKINEIEDASLMLLDELTNFLVRSEAVNAEV